MKGPAPSTLERAFLTRWKQFCPREPLPKPEYRFDNTRKWRFDFCFPKEMVAIECEGGLWTSGRHTRGAGYENDLAKYNRAATLGWCVLRFSKDMIDRCEAAAETLEALKLRRSP